ncbi:MAG TPA: hypothetical protein VG935_03185 [Patescibacteria group bacterium]|nr:hypothetical protein [Patescibacteria group bacterium]
MKNFAIFSISLVIGIVLPFLLIKLTSPASPKSNPTLPVAAPITSKFSLATAPSESLKGSAVNISGDVEWTSRVATEPAKITNGQTIQQGEDIVTGTTGNVTVLFAGDCKIVFDSATEMNFTQTLPSNFVFNQNKGTTTVTKDCINPLSIRALHMLIKQQSGEMTLTVDDTDQTLKLNIASGSAQVAFNDINNVSTVINVAADQTLTYDDPSRTADLE